MAKTKTVAPASSNGHVEPEAFVRAWQTSKSVAEAAGKVGLTTRQASTKAGAMRKKGVKLKAFRGRGESCDWDALKELADKLTTA